MRGFSTLPRAQVTFVRGAESVTYTVEALPTLFGTRVDICLPRLGEDAPVKESNRRIMNRGLVFTAEGLRATEAGIPALPASTSLTDWQDYCDALASLFTAAGLTNNDVTYLGNKILDLSSTLSIKEALEEEGNG